MAQRHRTATAGSSWCCSYTIFHTLHHCVYIKHKRLSVGAYLLYRNTHARRANLAVTVHSSIAVGLKCSSNSQSSKLCRTDVAVFGEAATASLYV